MDGGIVKMSGGLAKADDTRWTVCGARVLFEGLEEGRGTSIGNGVTMPEE